MLMSHAAISAASIGLPRLGPSAEAAPAARPKASQTAVTSLLRVSMLDPPRAVDRPAGDRVKMVVQHHRDRRDGFQLPALGDKLGTGRLHGACRAPGAVLKDCSPTSRARGHRKGGKRLPQPRPRQRPPPPAPPA